MTLTHGYIRKAVKQLNILGTEYKLIIDTDYCADVEADGITERYEKKIYMRNVKDMLEKGASIEAKQKRYDETLRHEIVHAFLFESGLDSYGCDETLVQWMAAKLPQVTQVFREVGCDAC